MSAVEKPVEEPEEGPKPLTAREKQRLEKLEGQISKAELTYIAVGKALAEIQESQLYRVEFDDFDSYVEDRWEMKKAHAYRLIAAAKLVGDWKNPPGNEAQARVLVKLDDEDLAAKVWAKVLASGKRPTANVIRAEAGLEPKTLGVRAGSPRSAGSKKAKDDSSKVDDDGGASDGAEDLTDYAEEGEIEVGYEPVPYSGSIKVDAEDEALAALEEVAEVEAVKGILLLEEIVNLPPFLRLFSNWVEKHQPTKVELEFERK